MQWSYNVSLLWVCLCNNSKWFLPSFVSSFSCTVLLLWCFLLDITGCTACCLNSWSYFREKAIVPFKKGGGLIFSSVAYFRKIMIVHVSLQRRKCLFVMHLDGMGWKQRKVTFHSFVSFQHKARCFMQLSVLCMHASWNFIDTLMESLLLATHECCIHGTVSQILSSQFLCSSLSVS